MEKALIAYFSRKGNNYVNGCIENLTTGNTEVVAKKIQSLIGGDLFEIQTVHPYAEDYSECTQEAKKELSDGARPQLKATMPNMTDYDVIYLGYPNWWGTMPMAIFTFLESQPISGKTIRPFCTHEGSSMGKSENDIASLCPDTRVLRGLAIQGGSAAHADSDIENWIRNAKLI